MFLPILALALGAPAPEPLELPKGPAPKVFVLNVDKDSRGYLDVQVTITKYVTETRTITMLVGGVPQVRNQQVQVPVTTMERRRVAVSDDGVAVYGPDGKKFDPKNLPKLAGPAPVLLSADGKDVDPFYLSLAKSGTLIVVAPSLAGAQPVDAVLTPDSRPPDLTPPKP
jgi:hypothetical protein